MLDRHFEVGLTQSLVDHATLSTACHVGHHVGLFFHLKFLGPLCPQALVYNEVGWSWPFPPTKIVNFNGHGPSSTRLKWPGFMRSCCYDRIGHVFILKGLVKEEQVVLKKGGCAYWVGKNVVAKHLEAEYGLLRIEAQQVQKLAVTFGISGAFCYLVHNTFYSLIFCY